LAVAFFLLHARAAAMALRFAAFLLPSGRAGPLLLLSIETGVLHGVRPSYMA
jgi:hypothetical protein